MRLMRFIGATSTAGVMALALVGTAAADVNLNQTGPDSTQKVSVDNSSDVQTTNTNSVQILNVSTQKSSTGDVTANDNTSVSGGLASGNASNAQTVATTVTVGNEAVGSSSNPGSGEGSNPGGSVGGSQSCNCSTGTPGMGGSVLGASTTPGMGGGQAILPVTGATVPVDVSGLRAAWHPNSPAAQTLVNQSKAISQWMLLVAALLSLTGATASVIYARRQEGRS